MENTIRVRRWGRDRREPGAYVDIAASDVSSIERCKITGGKGFIDGTAINLKTGEQIQVAETDGPESQYLTIRQSLGFSSEGSSPSANVAGITPKGVTTSPPRPVR